MAFDDLFAQVVGTTARLADAQKSTYNRSSTNPAALVPVVNQTLPTWLAGLVR